jgi:hypothetical protein
VSRYDLTSQAGKKLSIPYSPPSTQAVQSNMVYLRREVFMVSSRIAARRINAIRYASQESLCTAESLYPIAQNVP